MKPVDRLLLLVVAAASLAGLAMTFAAGVTSEYDVLANATGEAVGPGFDPALAEAVAGAMEDYFGGYRKPELPEGGIPGVASVQELRAGRSGYAVKCTQCHGVTGAADTGTARLLRPRPRSFRLGKIKFTSTAAGQPPVHADLERMIRDGIPTTSMAGFPTLPESAHRELAGYVQYLLMRGATERAVLKRLGGPDGGGVMPEQVAGIVAEEYAQVRKAWAEAEPAEPPVPETSRNHEAYARAAQLFQSAACLACHGAGGGGKGPASFSGGKWLLRDEWGNEARPRAFANGKWFGGSAPEDLYRRIAFGVKGTPMPPSVGSLTPEEIWALVHYVQDLARRNE